MSITHNEDSASLLSSRFASGREWLARRMDWECGRQEIAEAKESRRRTLIKLLPAHLVMDGPPVEYGDRIETTYPCRRTDQRPEEDSRVWIYGPSWPMSEPELESYFKRQIQASTR